MNVSLREITSENWLQCVKLKVADDQTGFVASNAVSLAQSKYEPQSQPLAIYDDNNMVGFLMYHSEEENREKTWFIERLMVGKQHQGKGYGRRGMQLLLERLKTDPTHTAVYISFVPENGAARSLYTSLGFEDTGEIYEGEVVFRMALPNVT